MKKLLLLGGSRYLLPVIKAAHKLGIYVITCDYLPDNIAHKHADEYCNVSIVEKEKVLEVAKERDIDGIMSFACDPGVVTAAYIAEKLGLPFQCSYESAYILQDKGLFRKFLADHDFYVPHARSYRDKKAALADVDYFTWPVIVKPVDSAGSKGVTKVDKFDDLDGAIDLALSGSFKGMFIIEDFLSIDGYRSDTDSFTIDGELRFITYSDQLFDAEADNPYTPSLIIWPSTMKKRHQKYLTDEIQRLMKLLGMKTGIYNIETCVGSDGKPYIMEVSPRGGGNEIAELQKLAYGVDLIEEEVRKAVGLPMNEIVQGMCDGYWCTMSIHANFGESGVFKAITITPDIQKKYVKMVEIGIKQGDYVKPFTGADMALGNMILRFDTREELDTVMANVHEWLNIEFES